MKRAMILAILAVGAATSAGVFAETETIDGAQGAINLIALAKESRVRRDATPKACPEGERSEATRPAVMLLVVSDAAGKEIATGPG